MPIRGLLNFKTGEHKPNRNFTIIVDEQLPDIVDEHIQVLILRNIAFGNMVSFSQDDFYPNIFSHDDLPQSLTTYDGVMVHNSEERSQTNKILFLLYATTVYLILRE